MAFDLGDYNDVASRIVEFREKYPLGSLQQVDVRMFEVGGKSFVCYTAAAYRSPDDIRPGHGTAWEPVPGASNFKRDSEVQNAETSAWGRALIAVGAADAKKGIASREEVRGGAVGSRRVCVSCGDPLEGAAKKVDGGFAHADCVGG